MNRGSTNNLHTNINTNTRTNQEVTIESLEIRKQVLGDKLSQIFSVANFTKSMLYQADF